jgi:hypothetical protein
LRLFAGRLRGSVTACGIGCRVPSRAGRRAGGDQRLERAAGWLRYLRAGFPGGAVLPR